MIKYTIDDFRVKEENGVYIIQFKRKISTLDRFVMFVVFFTKVGKYEFVDVGYRLKTLDRAEKIIMKYINEKKQDIKKIKYHYLNN